MATGTRAPRTIVTINLQGQTDFNIPFEYLARKFVVVTLLGVDRKVLVLNTDYRFVGKTTISLANPTPAGYTQLELRRVTSATERLVDFYDGSILRAYDLNLSQIQTLHVAEEARDSVNSDSISIDDDYNLDARNRRIVNLMAGREGYNDAVNMLQLEQYDTSTLENSRRAEAAADRAENAVRAALTYVNVSAFGGNMKNALSAVRGLPMHIAATSNVTIRVPTDALTLQEAVTKVIATGEAKVSVIIEAGHVLTAPLILKGGSYSAFTISSVDPLVTVEDDCLQLFAMPRTGLRPVFGADLGCEFPVVNVKVDLRNYKDNLRNRSGSGFVACGGSVMNLGTTAGCLGGFQGVIAFDGSVINAADTDFQHSVEAAITAWSGSSVYAPRANASFSAKYGVRSTEGSSLVFADGIATDCGRHAARAVTSSFLDVSSADLSRSATNGVYARHSCVVNANNAKMLSCSERGVYALRACTVTCVESDMSGSLVGVEADGSCDISGAVSKLLNCPTGFLVKNGSSVDLSFADCSGVKKLGEISDASTGILAGIKCDAPDSGVLLTYGSTGDFRAAQITNSKATAISVWRGSKADATDAVMTGAKTNAIYASASQVAAHSANVSGSNRGFVAEKGGTINAIDGIADNCIDDGLYAITGGIIAFAGGKARGCNRGARAVSGSIKASNADFSGCTAYGVFAADGSDVSITSANCRKGTTDSTSDVLCGGGSTVRMAKATGGTSIPKNVITNGALILG